MDETNFNLTRRKFMIVGSAAVAAPFVLDLAGIGSKAKGAAAKEAVTGGVATKQKIYFITSGCVGCQVCRYMCPVTAIAFGDDRNEIDQKKCIHCGTCYRNCPVSVISEI